MLAKLGLICMLCLGASNFAAAQAVPATAQTALSQLVGELQDLRVRQKTAQLAAERERRLLAKQAARLDKQEKDIASNRSEWRKEQAAIDTAKAQLTSSGCTDDGSAADPTQASRCKSGTAALAARSAKVQARDKVLIKLENTLRQNRASLNHDGLTASDDAKRLTELHDSIAAIEARLAAACPSVSTSTSAEALKRECSTPQFGLATAKLPPCATPACTAFDKLVGPGT